jgi:NADH-quinone oxidoreductase subunit C
MLDQLVNFPALKEVYDSLEKEFKDAILESSFEKQELSAAIKKEFLLPVLQFLKIEKGFNALNDMIGLDNLSYAAEGKKRFSVVYQLYKFPEALRIRIKVDVDAGDTVDSIQSVYKSSDWAEREIFDMFGIGFAGHPNLRRIYMQDDFDGHPLRKDFPLEGKK